MMNTLTIILDVKNPKLHGDVKLQIISVTIVGDMALSKTTQNSEKSGDLLILLL